MSVDHLNVMVNDGFGSNEQSIKIVENAGMEETHEEKCLEDSNATILDGENVCLVSPSSDCDNKSFVVKLPRANSKLILQNMEEVLNSVKKKHRQKHRRKKEQKKLAMLAEAKVLEQEKLAVQQQIANDEINSISVSQDMDSQRGGDYKGGKRLAKSFKKPLQEQQLVHDEFGHYSSANGKGKHCSNGKRRKTTCSSKSNTVATEVSTNTNAILQHLVNTPRKNAEESLAVENIAHQNLNQESIVLEYKLKPTPAKPTTNAFEVMMNARNKSIGSNTPGKEVNNSDELSPVASCSVNTKRKLLLQSWSERKGGLKRKLDDEMRATYIEERLQDRAKRLKRMLAAGTNSTSRGAVSPSDTMKPSQPGSTESGKSKRRCKTLRRRSKRQSSTDSVGSNTEKQRFLDAETVEFLSKLSSPTKKRDSLLGYFAKIPSPEESNGKVMTSTPVSTKVVNTIKKNLINDTSIPKRRGRRVKTKQHNNIDTPLANDDDIKVPKPENQNETPPMSTRPKRACREKTKYEYDQDMDDSLKEEQTNERSKRKQIQTLGKATNDDYDGIVTIDLDSSTSFTVSSTVMKTPKKLAPLFVRSVPKPSVDPEALRARQEFLRSGVPDILKLEQDKQKLYDQCYEDALELFPKITHIHQWNIDEERLLAECSNKNKRFSYREFNKLFETTNNNGTCGGGNGRKSKIPKVRSTTLIGITNCTSHGFDFKPDKTLFKNASLLSCNIATTQPLQPINLALVHNKRLIIKAWKADFDRFQTFKCYNQLRTKYRFFSALDSAQDTEQVTESFVVTRSTRRSLEASSSSMSSTSQLRSSQSYFEDDVKPPATAPNGELLFTEKYKPMLFEQVLVNWTPVSQLRDFLATWANGTNNANGNAGGSAKISQNLLDDSIDFTNDSNSSQPPICNSVVLLGPASSGKTNAVFTLANEMNFNVLEINAGMKRTGKKLIQELLEATQSHQIRNESAGGSSAAKSKAQKNLLKISLNSLKVKKQTPNTNHYNNNDNYNGNISETELSTNAQTSDLNVRKCLILIEDADIVFDQTDAGFTDAVYMLAASSKRPVIVIATNPNCQHLQRLMAQNIIHFTAPNALSISKYLAILSLMENCPITLDDLISLYLYNQRDLRKTLHELQFFIQSGGDHKKQERSNLKNPIYCNGNNSTSSLSTMQKQQQQKTPQKQISEQCQNQTSNSTNKYFASPGQEKLSESEDAKFTQSQVAQVHDEQLKREKERKHQSNLDDTYLHRTLFEFYTVDQNADWRVPFPVNFNLFYVNMGDIFAMAKKLKPQINEYNCPTTTAAATTTKRKTRSPKKIWLSTATANKMVYSSENYQQSQNHHHFECLNALSNFYNNVSIANSVVARDEFVAVTKNGLQYERDRLMPYLSESIAHNLLEQAINIDLEAELCPYNLFETQRKSTMISDLMGSTMMMMPKRSRSMDFEPALRAICRSERQRASQERRSTRFYHYLRNSCIDMCNFSLRPFDTVCSVFQTQHDENSAKE